MIRCLGFALAALFLHVMTAPSASGGESIVTVTNVQVTAAAPHELAAISATITNRGDQTLTMVAITTSATSPGMFHFSFNMCEPGTSMIKVPSIIVPVGRSVRLSTRGAGAMVQTKQRGLRVGRPIAVAITIIRGSRHFVVRSIGHIVARPRGLKRSYGGSVGAR